MYWPQSHVMFKNSLKMPQKEILPGPQDLFPGPGNCLREYSGIYKAQVINTFQTKENIL